MYLAIHIKSSVQEIIRLDVLIHLDTLSESYGFVSAIHLPLEYIMNSLLVSHYKDKQKHLDFLSTQLYELCYYSNENTSLKQDKQMYYGKKVRQMYWYPILTCKCIQICFLNASIHKTVM